VRTWSTLSTAPAGQFRYWRELICEAFLDLTPESDVRDRFTGIVTQWPLGELSLARIDSQRQRVMRTDLDISRAPRAGYYANLQLRGTSKMRQGDRVAVLRPGDIAVVDTGQQYAFDFDTDFRQLSLFIPRALLDAQVSGPVRTATRVDTATGVGAAVRQAMVAMARSALTPQSAVRLATLTGGMLSIALDSAAGTRCDEARSVRSYRAALADIEEHLADDDLSPATTARRLGVSVRWLHRLFAGRERTYAGTVRRLRLEIAWRNLQDRACAHLRVIDIAADAGFGDVTSFHRAFRREFGRTPAQVRADSTAMLTDSATLG
jgi:AraC family transcriptional activator of tynA and feaB